MTETPSDASPEESGLIFHDGVKFSSSEIIEYEEAIEGKSRMIQLTSGIQFTGRTYFGGEPLYQILGTKDDQVLAEIVGGTYDNGIAPIPMPEDRIGERTVFAVNKVATACIEQQDN